MPEPQYDGEDMNRFYALQEERQRKCSGCDTEKHQCDYWKRQGRAACCPDCTHGLPVAEDAVSQSGEKV